MVGIEIRPFHAFSKHRKTERRLHAFLLLVRHRVGHAIRQALLHFQQVQLVLLVELECLLGVDRLPAAPKCKEKSDTESDEQRHGCRYDREQA